MKEIVFTSVRAPHGWLGNMSPYPIDHGGHIWRTSEALFQSMRFSDESIRAAIRDERSPMSAKMVAKKNRQLMTNEPMSALDVDNMLAVLGIKITQHPSLRIALLETGDARIIEDCTSRQRGSGLFWGAAKVDGKWKGANTLGVLWMALREELRSK